MKHLLIGLFTFFLTNAIICSADDELYINDCPHYGALAVAVAYVRDNNIFSEEILINNQIEFFKRSNVSPQDIIILVQMIRRVYISDQIISEQELFQQYMQECIIRLQTPKHPNQYKIIP